MKEVYPTHSFWRYRSDAMDCLPSHHIYARLMLIEDLDKRKEQFRDLCFEDQYRALDDQDSLRYTECVPPTCIQPCSTETVSNAVDEIHKLRDIIASELRRRDEESLKEVITTIETYKKKFSLDEEEYPHVNDISKRNQLQQNLRVGGYSRIALYNYVEPLIEFVKILPQFHTVVGGYNLLPSSKPHCCWSCCFHPSQTRFFNLFEIDKKIFLLDDKNHHCCPIRMNYSRFEKHFSQHDTHLPFDATKTDVGHRVVFQFLTVYNNEMNRMERQKLQESFESSQKQRPNKYSKLSNEHGAHKVD